LNLEDGLLIVLELVGKVVRVVRHQLVLRHRYDLTKSRCGSRPFFLLQLRLAEHRERGALRRPADIGSGI
jgi:hypothetical protein